MLCVISYDACVIDSALGYSSENGGNRFAFDTAKKVAAVDAMCAARVRLPEQGALA